MVAAIPNELSFCICAKAIPRTLLTASACYSYEKPGELVDFSKHLKGSCVPSIAISSDQFSPYQLIRCSHLESITIIFIKAEGYL